MRDLVRFLVIGIFLIAGAGVALGQEVPRQAGEQVAQEELTHAGDLQKR